MTITGVGNGPSKLPPGLGLPPVADAFPFPHTDVNAREARPWAHVVWRAAYPETKRGETVPAAEVGKATGPQPVSLDVVSLG